MIVTNARSTTGISARVTPTSPTSSGTIQVGANDETSRFTDADVIYSVRALLALADDELILDLFTGDPDGSTAWVAGTAQVETATAAGTISGSGNATVVVTAAGVAGSPVTVSLPVLNGDTASVWAGKVRTALAANTAIGALYTVGGATTAIILTRKTIRSIVTPAETVLFYAANDSTLNISLDNGTCTGITTEATSANTTAGVATSGVKIYGADVDFEGNAIPAIDKIKSYLVDCSLGSLTYSDGGEFAGLIIPGKELKEFELTSNELLDVTYTAAEVSDITITVLGVAQ